MRQKGERWTTHDRREVLITFDLSNGFVRVINENGFLEVIHENHLKEWLNQKDFENL
jgi:isochorismate hydrolase